MSPQFVVSLGRNMIWTVLMIAGPLLLAGLVVGILVAIFQAVTQIHEMTLTFIPKILVVMLTFVILLPYLLSTLMDYVKGLFLLIPKIAG